MFLLCIRITRDVKNWSFFFMENEIKYAMLVLYVYMVRVCVFSFFHKPRPRLHIREEIRLVLLYIREDELFYIIPEKQLL